MKDKLNLEDELTIIDKVSQPYIEINTGNRVKAVILKDDEETQQLIKAIAKAVVEEIDKNGS